MDGAKPGPETRPDSTRVSGRGATGLGRSWGVTPSGPTWFADLGGSRSVVRWESSPPEAQGFLGTVRQPRVSRS